MMNNSIENPRPQEYVKMARSLFLVDVEATSPSPMTGKMTDYGIVHLGTMEGFYAHLWPHTPHPDIPALPVVEEGIAPEVYTSTYDKDGARTGLSETSEDPLDALRATVEWLQRFPTQRPVLVSDNPGFDAMWITCLFDEYGLENPFGFSSRRIGDFYAGTVGKWYRASAWKKLRRTRHTHNPQDDARGNAEALETILLKQYH